MTSTSTLPPISTSLSAQSLFQKIDAVLPQTQCTRCGYPSCSAYAKGIASGDAAINQCPPGGAEGVQRLAAVTGLPVLLLNPVFGREGPRTVAIIDEAWCIGCTLCIKACPTDAIFGSNKMMHTVIEPYCTGCELCVPVCPVDCISLENVSGERTGWAAWSVADANTARQRYEFRISRRQPAEGCDNESPTTAEKQEHTDPSTDQPMFRPSGAPESGGSSGVIGSSGSAESVSVASTASSDSERKRAAIESAMAKARARRNTS